MAPTKSVPKILEDMTPEEREEEHLRRLREFLETKKADIGNELKGISILSASVISLPQKSRQNRKNGSPCRRNAVTSRYLI